MQIMMKESDLSLFPYFDRFGQAVPNQHFSCHTKRYRRFRIQKLQSICYRHSYVDSVGNLTNYGYQA